MYRRARFIWTAAQPIDREVTFRSLLRDGPVRRDDGVNRWFLFRRTFALPGAADEADLSITVDGRYVLYVNGHRVGRGPVRSSPDYLRVDRHDIAPFLEVGENAIAVLVHVYGVDTGWYETAKAYWQTIFGDGGLYCEGCVRCGTETIDILSDTDWRCLECQAWRRDVPRSGWGQGFIEDFDASKMPQGWTQAGFNDSDWEPVHELIVEPGPEDAAKGWGPIEPFPVLCPREIPPLPETPLAPDRIVAVHGVTPKPELALDRRLYDEPLKPLPGGLIENAEALLHPDDAASLIRTAPGCDVAVVLAFDCPHSGYPFIEIEARGGEVIEVGVAETIPGEFSGEWPEKPRLVRESYLDCAHLFRYTARAGVQRFEKFEWTAVRYLQLVVRNAPDGVKIRHVGSVSTHYPVDYRGKFECSDDLLNKLWTVGRYTALQCTHDAWCDGPSRENRQWIGDGLVHFLIDAAAFGPSSQAVDRQFLLHAMEAQRRDGLLEMFAPGDHHANSIVIPDFSLHWICAARHYLMHTGDLGTAEEVFPVVQRVLAWFERHVGPNDLLVDIPHWHFIEWAKVGRRGEAAIINAMFAGALGAAADLAVHLDYGRAKQRYEVLAARIKAALNARHWDAGRGAYVDSVDPDSGLQDRQISQQANAAMILWDIAPTDRWPAMIARITDPDRLKLTAVPPIVCTDEPFDPDEDVVRANTYFSHFVYSALARAGRFDLALEQMRRFYRPMLEAGARTLWESFEPIASLCHAFSATPVHQLSAHALGIAPMAPGFARFQVAPQPADLDFARGVYPTVRGDIAVEWTRSEDAFDLVLTVPEGTRAEIIPPPSYEAKERLDPLPPGRHRLILRRTDPG